MGLQFVRRWLAVGWLGLGVAGCASQKPPLGTWEGPKSDPQMTVEKWSYQGKPGFDIQTSHYAIYTTISDDQSREMLPRVMEGGFAEYRKLAVNIPVSPRPMDCYIFGARDEWNDFTRTQTGANSVTYLQIRRGGYALGDRYVAYNIGARPTASVAAHEGWHQFVARNFRGRLPPFLEEGLATTFEGIDFKDDLPRWNCSVNPLRAQALRHAVDSGHMWPLDQLIRLHAGNVVNRSGDEIEAFYAECWAFARFMREAENGRYLPALHKWLAETADGTVFDPSHSHTRQGLPWNPGAVRPMMEHYLGMSLPEIDQAYQAYIHKVAYDEYPAQWNMGIYAD
jgi:hypothetical protein